jgi:arsenate reductase-like glutaredoxin family protein
MRIGGKYDQKHYVVSGIEITEKGATEDEILDIIDEVKNEWKQIVNVESQEDRVDVRISPYVRHGR